ncbi:MAG: helix-turn-helix domain-containing protein [Thermosediminibacteraceae bacterium]|nr:helix-turn-helix domain-containing protein [Thermosediminibacteraceae bacterium]
MAITFGKKIYELRKEKGLTQEELSEKLGVSPQAVSKWENDLSYPDVMLLPKIAQILGVTVDELLSTSPKKETVILPESQRKNIDDLILKIVVNSSDGDKIRVNLPMSLVKIGLEMGMKMPNISGNNALKEVDLEQILALVEKGVIGKLVDVESARGDIIEIVVE